MPDNRVFDRRQFLITAAAGAGVSASVLTSSSCTATDVGATTGQRVHPVLVRNDHSELIRVTVEVGQPDVRATSFAFSLGGTDQLEDIETLRLFYAEDKGSEALDHVHSGSSYPVDKQELLAELTATPFGDPSEPAAELTFSGDQVLRPGTNASGVPRSMNCRYLLLACCWSEKGSLKWPTRISQSSLRLRPI